jgi:peptide methionine sulfoxide reductase MsrA
MKSRSDYAPHDRHPAFDEGLAAYNELLREGFTRTIANPHQPNSLAAQAWDRGYEYGSHLHWAKRKDTETD